MSRKQKWQEALVVYPKTHKLTQKKKRKVDTPTSQEPGPAKVAVTSGVDQPGISRKNTLSMKSNSSATSGSAGSASGSYSSCPSCSISKSDISKISDSVSASRHGSASKAMVEKTPTGRSWRCQEEQQQRIGGRRRTLPSSRSSPSISTASSLCGSSPSMSGSASLSQLSQTISRDDAKQFLLYSGPKSRAESGCSSLEKNTPATDSWQPSLSLSGVSPRDPLRRSQVIDQLEGDHVDNMDTSSSSEPTSSSSSFSNTTRQTRHSRPQISKKQEQALDSALKHSAPGVSRPTMPCYRRSKSLDRRAAEAMATTATPDLLNFKKGWMTRRTDKGQWKKHWFILTDQTLRFYRDAVAEEAADLDGEINLSTCYDITDYPVPRNYGFQIHTAEGAFTLCAMTAGIRRNWVQAIMKNVRPTVAPDVTSSLTEQKEPTGLQDPAPTETRSAVEDVDPDQRKNRSVRERRREGRYKTFDWADFSHQLHHQGEEKEAEPSGQPRPVVGWDTADGGSPSPVSSSSSPVASNSCSSVASSSTSQCLRDTVASQEAEVLERGAGPTMLPQAPSTATPLEERSVAGTKTPTTTTTLVHAQNKVFEKRAVSEVDSSSTSSTLELPIGCGDDDATGHNPSDVPSVALSDGLGNTPSNTPCDGTAGVRVDVVIEQHWQQVASTPLREERWVPISNSDETTEDTEQQSYEQQTGQLVGELEQTQRELSRLQQVNISLQQQLQQERERSRESRLLQNGLPTSFNPSSSAEACAWQRLQKLNQDLRFELEAQRRSQEVAREAELQRRAELIALQAQALSAGEAAALAHSELQQERRSALKQREEEEHDHRQETERLRQRLQEVSAQMKATEKVQAEKEVRLQKHLGLLQESQERERRSLGASLAQAERRTQDLQEQLQKAEQQAETLLKGQGQPWARGGEVAEAQQQLQEELARTLAAVGRLQGEGEQLERRCQELQNQLAEVDGEVDRLQRRLQTEETDYYNLEHSYESVSEELQRALGQAQEREVAARDAREDYERLLDRKERELSEALVKMAALGSSLEETELKLSEAKKACTCCSSLPLFKVTDNRLNIKSSGLNSRETQTIHHSYNTDGAQTNGSGVPDVNHSGPGSCSVDPAYQYIVTAGDDPDRFMSVIQVLETKLYVTEEKLRDITQRLEEPQGQWCSGAAADPHLRSQLTQSRAATQRLSLLLHNQAKQSRRFTLETEGRTRVLGGQCQAALASVQACRERIQALLRRNPGEGSNVDLEAAFCALEMQLVTAAACLSQGGIIADEQWRECNRIQREEEDLIDDKTQSCATMSCPEGDEAGMETLGRALALEASTLEKMASALQSQDDIFCQTEALLGGDEGDSAHMYTDVLSKRMALGMGCGKPVGGDTESEKSAIARVCARAELAYISLTLQRRYQGEPMQEELHSDNPTREQLWRGSEPEEQCGGTGDNKLSSGQARGLADISPPELAPYEEQVQLKNRGLTDNMLERDQSVWSGDKAEKQHNWTERLAVQLRKRAKVLHQLCQEIPSSSGSKGESSLAKGGRCLDDPDSVGTLHLTLCWPEVLFQSQVTYVACRLQLDHEQELLRCKGLCDSLGALCQEQEAMLSEERRAFSHALSRLQEDSQALKEKLEWVEQGRAAAESETRRKVGVLLADIESIEDRHEEQVQKLEEEFQGKMRELQKIHEEEMIRLHSHHARSACVAIDAQHESRSSQTTPNTPPEKATSYPDFTLDSTLPAEELNMDGACKIDPVSMETMKNRIHVLETQVNTMKDEAGRRNLEGDEIAMKEVYQRDLENFKASCERGFTAMEAVHQKLVGDLQRQHQREVATLLQERDRLLEEETAATVAAIEAIRNAHREELERSPSGGSSDVTDLRSQYEVELRSLHRELEVLSGQYSKKCLESAQQNQALEADRQALLQCQRENQELSAQKQELTQRLTEEISCKHSLLSGELATAFQGKDLYELEVILRVRDTELQCLKQETNSLKEELKAAHRDKAYATDKLKALYAELSFSRSKVQSDIPKLREELQTATGSPRDEGRGGDDLNAAQAYDIVKSTSNPDFLKKERSTLTRQIRGVRSKSLKEGLSVQERMKLFEQMD
ncbi:centrosome-associated protein CEP250-like [Coregonus clupeaformis]|uniref:centrosome-associated protein CEP250-like n=1 Tax=Coregonus clupeaformis TaxID=59861 RepID=UPI001E1C5E1B|nr:centrosome-associated protein CEP250-like [Coregonus clupeaformis]